MSKIKEKNYKSLSGLEFQLVEFVVEEDLEVFRVDDLVKGLGFDTDKVYRLVSSLKRKDFIESPLNGRYVLDTPSFSVSLNQAASRIYWPSYISFWSALAYHNLTDQLPRTVYVANTSSSSETEFRGSKIDFVKLNSDYMFGYDKNDGFMAEPEKAVIDSLHLPRYSGGIQEVFKALDRELKIDRLEKYARKTGNSSVKKRLKYLLERKEIENSINVSGSYVKLDPSKGKGKKDKNCLVEDNVFR
jgi:predicted transcriptional regulator of viral defense system